MKSVLRKVINKNVSLQDFKMMVYYKMNESLHSKRPGSLLKKTVSFPKVPDMPEEIDAKFLNSDISHNFSFNGSTIDYINFEIRKVERYCTAAPYLSRAISLSKKTVRRKDMPNNLSYSAYFDAHKITPHTCHMSPDGYICATNKYYIYFINTKENKLYILPDDYKKKNDALL